MTPQELGKEIRAAREAAKLSQEALAERLGTSRRHVMRWEKGQVVPDDLYRERLLAELPRLRRRAFSVVRPGNAEARAEAESLAARTAALERRVSELSAALARIESALVDRGSDAKPPGNA